MNKPATRRTPDERRDAPLADQPEPPAAEDAQRGPEEDLTAGSEGGGRTIGLGEKEHPEGGSPARPLWDGH